MKKDSFEYQEGPFELKRIKTGRALVFKDHGGDEYILIGKNAPSVLNFASRHMPLIEVDTDKMPELGFAPTHIFKAKITP